MSEDAPVILRPEDLPPEELRAALCHAGDLSWKLHDGQLPIYRKYRAWEKTRENDEQDPVPGTFPRIFCIEKSGRFGGSTLSLLIKTEDAIRNPGRMYRISSAFQKNIEEIIDDVSRYVFDDIPADVRPVYRGSHGPMGAGFYFPVQPGHDRPSLIRLIGLDLHPDGSRGTASDGDVITEAGYVAKLLYVVKNVIYRQYQQRPWASMILETSAPNTIDTDWESVFLPDAKVRGAHAAATIEDNPLLSRREKDVFIAAMGGIDHPDCQREYFNVIAVDPKSRVVPEFDETRHVQEWERPDYAHCYESADPGSADLFGLLWGYYDWSRAAVYVERDWTAGDPLTRTVALAIREAERELWGAPDPAGAAQPMLSLKERRSDGAGSDVKLVTSWDPRVGAPPGTFCYYNPSDRMLHANPYVRVTDVDRRLVRDLEDEYDIHFECIVKGSREGMTNEFRDALVRGQFVIHPRCKGLISHLKAARWNPKRTDWERGGKFGHFDLLACAIYFWRRASQSRHASPNAPYRPTAVAQEVVDRLPWQRSAEDDTLAALKGVFAPPRAGIRVRR